LFRRSTTDLDVTTGFRWAVDVVANTTEALTISWRFGTQVLDCLFAAITFMAASDLALSMRCTCLVADGGVSLKILRCLVNELIHASLVCTAYACSLALILNKIKEM
jgi:hypothetical protein